jgi:hypothetical protein
VPNARKIKTENKRIAPWRLRPTFSKYAAPTAAQHKHSAASQANHHRISFSEEKVYFSVSIAEAVRDSGRTGATNKYMYQIAPTSVAATSDNRPATLSEGRREFMVPNVRGHRADEMKETIRYAASEAPGGPRC